MPSAASVSNIFAATPACVFIPTPTRQLADILVSADLLKTDLGLEPLDDPPCFRQVRLVHGKRQVGQWCAGAVTDVLHDHVDTDGGVGERLEHPSGNARPVGHADEGELGLVLIESHATNHDVFHAARLFFHNRPRIGIETGPDFEYNMKLFRGFHRSKLHHLGARAGQLEHLIVRDLIELAGVGHNPWIGRIHAVHIGVDLAEVGLERGGERDGRQV